MPASRHERVLAAELLAVMAAETFDALSGADNGKFSLPSPARYFATLVAYSILAAVAMFGEKPGKVASAIGGVAALTILMAPTYDKTTGKMDGAPVLVGAFAYFAQVFGGGTQAPGGGGGLSGTNVPAGGVGNPASTATGKSASPWATGTAPPLKVKPGLGPTAKPGNPWGAPAGVPNPIPTFTAG